MATIRYLYAAAFLWTLGNILWVLMEADRILTSSDREPLIDELAARLSMAFTVTFVVLGLGIVVNYINAKIEERRRRRAASSKRT